MELGKVGCQAPKSSMALAENMQPAVPAVPHKTYVWEWYAGSARWRQYSSSVCSQLEAAVASRGAATVFIDDERFVDVKQI
eukprot:SAG11_NODE_1599_length_4608_cov_8.741184_7_plen_81_part_00